MNPRLSEANKLFREKKYKESLSLYKKLRDTNPSLSIYTDNINSIYRTGYRPFKYSIVTAVYGVEAYLNDFLYSITQQTIGFTDNIELILVDDGSLDNSVEIIKRWQKEYPFNIKYIYKENGGQASARNMGMEHVTTDWVTFIDPDDFISENYIEVVNNYLIGKQKETILISCNFIFYFENSGKFSDTHPLRYRFNKTITQLELNNLSKNVQLSASTAFFKVEILRSKNIKMNPDIRPNFEDAEFVGRYLILANIGNVVFLKDAKYFYRKREQKTSSLDTSWSKKEQYSEKLKYGLLALLEFSEKNCPKIPEYIEHAVLYDLIWSFLYLINHQEKASFLTKKEKSNFLDLIHRILSKISIEAILNFNLAGCWHFHKVGFLSFKNLSPEHNYVYLENYDEQEEILKIFLFSRKRKTSEVFTINNKSITPLITKIQSFDFMDQVFVFKKIIYLSIKKSGFSDVLQVKTKTHQSLLSIEGKRYLKGITIKDIIKVFKKELYDKNFPAHIKQLRGLSQISPLNNYYKNAWVFMDRDIQADDNAEHLYRYIKNNHPEKNIFFVIRKTSHDWFRLQKEGFRLVAFDSQEHKTILLNANYLFSSHADHYVVDLIENKYFIDLLNYRFIFLQHGITKDDISNWLNTKSIDLLITATKAEYNSIVKTSRYKFTEKETLLSGFPRHDHLLYLEKKIKTEKTLLIMPTWRKGLAGDIIGKGNQRLKSEKFYQSDYALAWKALLHSQILKNITEEYGYKVVFFPHVNMALYLDHFEVPDYISIENHTENCSMQTLFASTAMMLTDYSSVAFEMAYLKKPIIYYQFDYDFVFGGGHLTSKGYFSYEKNGFGPVCYDEKSVLNHLEKTLKNHCQSEPGYLKRIKETFEFTDGKCCQRVYDAVCKLKVDTGEPFEKNLDLKIKSAQKVQLIRRQAV